MTLTRKAPLKRTPIRTEKKPKKAKTSWRRVKRDRVDILWSKVVRGRDGGECQAPWEWTKRESPRPDGRCPRDEYRWQIEAHHVFGRGKYSTRYDPRNGIALCKVCHDWVERHDTEATAWAKERLGDVYDLLEILSRRHVEDVPTFRETEAMKLKAMLKDQEA